MKDSDFPGLKKRPRKEGPPRLIWVARADIVKAGYLPKTIQLHYDWSDETQHALVSTACMKFQAEMLEWASGRKTPERAFDGTVKALVRAYQRDPVSRYHKIKWNTRRTYDQVLEIIETNLGERVLARLGAADFQRWYEAARKPREPGGPERINKAHRLMNMFRRVVDYGVTVEIPECDRLDKILSKMAFEQPARRRERLTFEHVEAFIAAATERGRLSLALGTAMQFETMLRQRDVIGEWAPIAEGEDAGGIVLGGRRWKSGLTWADIQTDFKIYKITTKTGQIAAHDLRRCPLVMRLLALVPAERRVGPLIVDEVAARPYAEHAYAREWRIVADAAGIPRNVWNMDARAGGITEAEDAGAALDDIRATAAHTQATTTARYSRGAIGKSQKVAELRAAHRKERGRND